MSLSKEELFEHLEDVMLKVDGEFVKDIIINKNPLVLKHAAELKKDKAFVFDHTWRPRPARERQRQRLELVASARCTGTSQTNRRRNLHVLEVPDAASIGPLVAAAREALKKKNKKNRRGR